MNKSRTTRNLSIAETGKSCYATATTTTLQTLKTKTTMPKTIIIRGQKELKGSITVMGAKNEALKAVAASILFPGPVTITNIPDIADIQCLFEILISMGAQIQYQNHTATIDASKLHTTTIPKNLAQKIRASVVLIGPLLARYQKAVLPPPGGDTIGKRPIDFFIHALEKMGASVTFTKEGYQCTTKQLRGAQIFIPQISVTATETMMMAATLAKGTTVIKNCAQEPEIEALAANLNEAGAQIEGAGTHTITIHGKKSLKALKKWNILPDRIEAGTFAILAAATRSTLTIKRCDPNHLQSLLYEFDHIGVPYTQTPSTLTIRKTSKQYRATSIKTHEYPGFPTDLQSQLSILLTQCQGMSTIHETIFEGRLHYLETLKKFGAKVILFDPHRAAITGPSTLKGTTVESPDIRAGIAFLIAGLIAKNNTTIKNIYQIQRGAEDIVNRLKNIGADIEER